jgi:DNA-binding LacI/PurR family transcriptional regulator
VRVRWREVAAIAGVSEATVSRVMNGRPGVSERTRTIVLGAVEQLGGVHLVRPRQLRAGLVGLIVPELDNPIFPALAYLIEARLASAGYACVLGCATEEGVDESEYLGMLSERGVVGIIMVSGRHANTEGDQTEYIDLITAGMPMVFVNGYSPVVPAPFVSCDDRHAASLAVGHLASLGHRRIGFVSGPTNFVVAARKLEGYCGALSAVGIDVDDGLIVVDTVFSIEGGRAATGQLVERGATAVVAASDLLALGTILGARELGLAVPAEWSAVGFDDTTLMAYTDPPLTTVRQPVRRMSDHVTRLLLDQLGGGLANQREFLFRPELVVRASTAPAPVTVSAR